MHSLFDGAGNVWSEAVWYTRVNGRVPNPMISGAVAEMSNTGTILSGAKGYTGSTTLGLLSPIGQSAPGSVRKRLQLTVAETCGCCFHRGKWRSLLE